MKDEHRALARRIAAFLTVAATFACAPANDATTTESAQGAMATARAGGPMGGTVAPVNYDSLAARIVTQSAGIGEGDIVFVEGATRDNELLEDLAVQTAKVGGHPVIMISSDRMARRMFDDVPEQFDARPPKLGLKLAGIADVYLTVESGESEKVLDGVPAKRIAARSAAAAPVNELSMSRNIRAVNLGNGLYPTAERAARYGMTIDELARQFWSGINVDYGQLQASAERVRGLLSAGQQLRLTNPNGTDVTMSIAKRPIFVSDGVISADDRKRGGAATSVWLPAGEAFLAPVRGSAEGKLVVDRVYFQGQEIVGLTLTISKGKVTAMSAQSGLAPLQAGYDAAGAGKDEFGVLDIGLNPNITLAAGSKLLSWVPAGMVSIVVGNNVWAGGDNKANFGFEGFMPGSTVLIDGKALVQDGKLQGM